MPIGTIAQPIQYVKTMLLTLMATSVNVIPIINQSIMSAHVSIVKYCFPLKHKLCCYIFVNSLFFLQIKLLWIFVAISIIRLKDFQFFPRILYENLTILQFNLVSVIEVVYFNIVMKKLFICTIVFFLKLASDQNVYDIK